MGGDADTLAIWAAQLAARGEGMPLTPMQTTVVESIRPRSATAKLSAEPLADVLDRVDRVCTIRD